MSAANSRASSRQRRTSFILDDDNSQQQLPLARKNSTDKLPSLARVSAAYNNGSSSSSAAAFLPTMTAAGSNPATPSDNSLASFGSSTNSSMSGFEPCSSSMPAAGVAGLGTSNNNNNNNNISTGSSGAFGSASKVVPNAANVLAVRKLMEERCETHRLEKKIKTARRHNRERLEAMERCRMEAEDQMGQMSVRNILWIDDMKDCSSPNRAVRGVAPTAAAAAAASSSSRRGSNAAQHNPSSSSTSEEPVDHSYHFRHSRRSSSAEHNHHHHHLSFRKRSSSFTSSSSSGSITFAGVRRFGFATAALPNLAEKENNDHAREILALRSQPLQPQSLAPEAHALLVRHFGGNSFGALLKEYHDETIEAFNEWRRFSDNAVDSLSFIFEEASMPVMQSGRGILRDPRDDFYRELHVVAEQTRAMMQAQMERCNDSVLRALRSAAASFKQLKKEDAGASSASDVEADAKTTPVRPAFQMAAASVGFENRAVPNSRSIGVQVGANREEQLLQELEEMRVSFRQMQTDSIQREKGKDGEISSLQKEVERLTLRTQLLHQCLVFQKEGTAAAIGKVSVLEKQMEDQEQKARKQQQQQQQQQKDEAFSTATSNNVSAAPSASASQGASPDLKEYTGSFDHHPAFASAAEAAADVVPKTPPPVFADEEQSEQQQQQQQQQKKNAITTAAGARSFREKAVAAASSSASASNDNGSNNFSQPSSGCVTPREESFEVKKPQQQQQHAHTPQTESIGSFRFPHEENNSSGEQEQKQQQLPAKPRSASRRLSMPTMPSSSNHNSGNGKNGGGSNSARGSGAAGEKENANNAGAGSKNIVPLGASSRKNSMSTGGGACTTFGSVQPLQKEKHYQQQQQQQQPPQEPVCVQSSLKRMETWQATQSQLWERRRSQLVAHTAYEGMLKLSRNSSSSSSVATAAAPTATTSGRGAAPQQTQEQQQQPQQVVAVPVTTYAPSGAPSVPSGAQPFGSSCQHVIPGAKRK